VNKSGLHKRWKYDASVLIQTVIYIYMYIEENSIVMSAEPSLAS